MTWRGYARSEDSVKRVHRWSLLHLFRVSATALAATAVLTIAVWIGTLLWLDSVGRSTHDDVERAMFAGVTLRAELAREELGARAYARSGDQAALERYRDAQEHARKSLGELQVLAASGALSPETVDRITRLERSMTAWQAGFADRVVSGDTISPEELEQHARLFDQVEIDAAVVQGSLAVERDRNTTRLATLNAVLRGLGLALVVVLGVFLAVTGVVLRRWVVGPLSQLAAQVRAVVSGNLQQRVGVGGPREIRELGSDVDSMRVHILGELDRMQEVARDLERSNRNLEQFAYVASHDLQEPLRKVASSCRLLQRRYAGRLDERADQYIELAVDGAQRMQRLITDLLEFSRVGRTNTRLEPVDLGDVARSAATQLDVLRERTGGAVHVGELPTVRGNATLLRQLLINLIGNGLKFRRPDVPPVVDVTARPAPGDGWEIAVRDNGIGISGEDTERAFVIFERLHGDTYPGTGIGLALARRIVEFHGGRIWIDTNAPGAGTTVRFTLPAADDLPSDSTAHDDAAVVGNPS